MADNEKRRMVAWFDPRQLADTAVRVVISTVFGQFADRREAIAAANPIAAGALDPAFDFSAAGDEDGFWFDYVADVGDGWNPTYAVARLLARGALKPEDALRKLPRGSLLIMGGDEVYPTARRKEYQDRLLYPYAEAWKAEAGDEEGKRPALFAMPGNHDWYDGLRTFFHYFCRRTVQPEGQAAVSRPGRVIGGRRTFQTRSYFALRLPQGWWLWGTDNQLEGYVDQPQIDFFQFVAEKWMEPGSKLILCTGTPDWQYVSRKGPESFSTHSYLERLATDAVQRGHQLKLVLSGDSHHYVRYREGDSESGRNYITCGGGGAFLHPTHKLEDQLFRSEFPPPGQPFPPPAGSPEAERWEQAGKGFDRAFRIAGRQDAGGAEQPGTKALYPDAATSSRLARGNILFAFTNWQLTAALALMYLFFHWQLSFNGRVSDGFRLVDLLRDASFWGAIVTYWRLVIFSPWTVLLCLLSFVGYYYFADARGLKRLAVAAVHAVLQAVVVTLVICATLHCLTPADCPDVLAFLLLLLAAILAAFASATLVGLYLWKVLAWFGMHWGHFSSLRVQNYKSFLRLHIDNAGVLRVYPIGLDMVPADMGSAHANPPLAEHLIEGPISIS